MSFFYRIYGIAVGSNLPIPDLAVLKSTPGIDFNLSFLSIPPWLEGYDDLEWDSPPRFPFLREIAQGDYWQIWVERGTQFVFDRAGTKLWATWDEERSTLEDTTAYLLGSILGIILRLRGTISLHASAIVVNGQAIAIVGGSGAGKSTTAAAFAELGYPILSDDVVPLVKQGSNYWVQPAYPRLRLWSPSVKALYGDEDALPALTPTWDKRYLDLSKEGYQFQAEPVPLKAIYLLQPRRSHPDCPQIEPISAQTALLTLLPNTFGKGFVDKQGQRENFEFLSELVRAVPIRQVLPHADFDHLFKLCELMRADAETLPRLVD